MEVALLDLWLPILLSAVFVFVASSVIHMATPLHKGDFQKLPGEAAVLEAMRTQGVKEGSYMFPSASSMKEMSSPEMIEKMNKGPVGSMTIRPNGPIAMGKSLMQWFVYSVVISLFVAYICAMTLGPGTDTMRVFRVAGTVAVLAYAVGNVSDSIWKSVSWGITARFILDGIVYGLVTAGTFGWLWPGA